MINTAEMRPHPPPIIINAKAPHFLFDSLIGRESTVKKNSEGKIYPTAVFVSEPNKPRIVANDGMSVAMPGKDIRNRQSPRYTRVPIDIRINTIVSMTKRGYENSFEGKKSRSTE